eukprot:scaffold233092_cov37-Tisochrysis_lutea.AAC.3
MAMAMPMGTNMRPDKKKVAMATFGERIGRHARRFCCLKAVSAQPIWRQICEACLDMCGAAGVTACVLYVRGHPNCRMPRRRTRRCPCII